MCALSRASCHVSFSSADGGGSSRVLCHSHAPRSARVSPDHVDDRWTGITRVRGSTQRSSLVPPPPTPQSPMQNFFEGTPLTMSTKKARRKRVRSQVSPSPHKQRSKIWQRKLTFDADDFEIPSDIDEEPSLQLDEDVEDELWIDEMRPVQPPATRRDHKNLIRSMEQLCLTRVDYLNRLHSVLTRNLKLLGNEIHYEEVVQLLVKEFGQDLVDRVNSQNFSSLLDKEGKRSLFLGEILMSTRGVCTLKGCQRDSWLVSLCVTCGSRAEQARELDVESYLPTKKGGKRRGKNAKKAKKPEPMPESGLSTAERCEKSIMRSLDYILTITRAELTKNRHRLLKTSGGDVVFLLKNVCIKAKPGSRVWKKAREVTLEIIDMFASVKGLDKRAPHTDLLSFLEFLHGRTPLQPEFDPADHRDQIRAALKTQQLEDILRFDPSVGKPVLTESNYCTQCNIEVKNISTQRSRDDTETGESVSNSTSFKTPKKGASKGRAAVLSRSLSSPSLSSSAKSKEKEPEKVYPKCFRCRRPLRSTIHFDAVCLALIWLSVFEDCDIALKAKNSSAALEHIVRYMPYIRPYRNMEYFGLAMFKFQCYYLTHLVFIAANGIELDCWSDVCLDPKLFAEEFIFLVTNLKTVIKLDDPELVGEFLQCLRVFGMSEDNALMRIGVEYLLRIEEKGKKGTFVKNTSFYTKYHAAYCGIIGLAHEGIFPYDDSVEMSKKWRSFTPYLTKLNTSIVSRK